MGRVRGREDSKGGKMRGGREERRKGGRVSEREGRREREGERILERNTDISIVCLLSIMTKMISYSTTKHVVHQQYIVTALCLLPKA